MPKFLYTITNPAELALSRADIIVSSPQDEITDEEEALLVELDTISSDSGFDGRYVIKADQAFALSNPPMEGDESVPCVYFEGKITFGGDLLTYGVCKIGSLAVSGSNINIQALSLVFHDVTLFSCSKSLELGLVELEGDKVLHVPACRVDDIMKVCT